MIRELLMEDPGLAPDEDDASIDGDLTIDDITPEMRAECERFGIDPDFMVGEINMFEFS